MVTADDEILANDVATKDGENKENNVVTANDVATKKEGNEENDVNNPKKAWWIFSSH